MENNSFHFKFRVGGFECMVIHDGDANDWDRNVLLIKTGQQNVLIDTGNGIDLTPRGFLLDRLQAVDISPADVDVVILSHADWDHIGGGGG
jgi:glyoxylase-like metal-dependent hydrolase (beta-lactamase superfamily II)